jgi:lipopolysaccharide/colanic/teichoic acid biosynthesis glycosyltransferase
VKLIGLNQFHEELLGHVPLATLDAAFFQYLMHPRFRGNSQLGKRALDLAVGGLAAIVFAPLMALAAVAIKLSDGGPVFFRQRRIGAGGREFEILKLRTMRVDADKHGAEWSREDDDRVTRVGKVLRRTHLDEVPQLWNVLRDEMSLVGPRPEQPSIVAELEWQIPFYDRRELVKPGITGWAQIRCGYAGSEAGTAWKLCHDLYYLKHRSVALDAMIMVQTLVTAVHDVQFAVRAPDENFVLEAVRASADA